MAGVIFEGGSLRGIFSAGVADALLDCNVHFDYFIGVSAGISYGITYISNQKGRNVEIYRKYRNDPRYFSFRNIFRTGSVFDLDFVYGEIPNKLIPSDNEAVNTYPGTVLGVTTDAQSGEPVYMSAKNMDDKFTLLRASAALPFFFPPVYMNGKRYFDGGLSDSIPIKKSIADGNQKNLVVLTQPLGYRKKVSNTYKIMAKLYKKKYPNMAKLFLTRAERYNETIDYIEKLEKETPENIVVLRPDYKLKSFESDVSVLDTTFQHGYDKTVESIERIRKLVEN